MKDSVPNPQLQASRISATISTGFNVTTADGKPARLAIVDEEGNVVEVGAAVAWAAWRGCASRHKENYWKEWATWWFTAAHPATLNWQPS